MSAFTPANSTEYTAFALTPATLANSYRWGSKLRVSSASPNSAPSAAGNPEMAMAGPETIIRSTL